MDECWGLPFLFFVVLSVGVELVFWVLCEVAIGGETTSPHKRPSHSGASRRDGNPIPSTSGDV
jgi:hypothetical protein